MTRHTGICLVYRVSVFLVLAGYMTDAHYHPAAEENNIHQSKERYYHYDDQSRLNRTESILYETKTKIRSSLESYDFNYSGVSKLEDLVIETGGQPLRTVIVSSWRTGSTFLGELLDAMPGNFYHYEPLLDFGNIEIQGPPKDKVAMIAIKKLFKCNYDNMDDYLEFCKNYHYPILLNKRLYEHCQLGRKDLCMDPQFLSRFCKLFPFQLMKLVRIRLQPMEALLQDKELNVKVILLVRDPRAVMQSRLDFSFFHLTPDIIEPERLCAGMVSNYHATAQFLNKYPDRFMVLRYEDLVFNMDNMTRTLFEFQRQEKMPEVDEFLHTHTSRYVAARSSTFRVSEKVPFKWKNLLDFEYVNHVQESCKEAMNLWGYQEAHNATHMQSDEFNPLGKYTIRLGI